MMEAAKPQDIRREMAETRQDIAHSIDRIQERTQPEHLQTLAKSGLKKARKMAEYEAAEQLGKVTETIDTAGSTVTQIVRRHPIATTLVGLAIGLLLRRKSTTQHHRNDNSKGFSK
jgi:ElaB/YqjD/DUF883 family membrane-anchored ribosome-binding protein